LHRKGKDVRGDYSLCIKRQNDPIIGLDRPMEFQEVEAPRFQNNRKIKMARLTAAPAAFTPQEIFLVLISVRD
jgi:hypothetical protein